MFPISLCFVCGFILVSEKLCWFYNRRVGRGALKDAYLDLQNSTSNEDDIILIGDLNGKAPGVTAGSYITMDAIAQIPNIVFTINEETNTRGGKAYDNIIFQNNNTTEYSNSSGVNTFWLSYGLDEDQGFLISDHKLVWATFNILGKDDN